MTAFVPHHALVTAPRIASPPARWLLVLHGILGRGVNWRSFARKVVAARPDWGAVLVDLRAHGRSLDAAAPHTVSAAADDLVALIAELAADGRAVRGVCGHSFGGKVALALVDRAADAPDGIDEAWILDAPIGARPDAFAARPPAIAVGVLETLDALPERFASREAFVDAVRAAGHPVAVARWLAQNVEADPAGESAFRFALDLSAIRALITDHFAIDAWPIVERARARLRFVVAGRSPVVSPGERGRLAAIAATPGGRVSLDVVEDVGHWLHVERPSSLLDLLAPRLGRGT